MKLHTPYSILSTILIIFILSACTTGLYQGNFSIKQGLSGRVIWKEGNLMPSPDKVNTNNGVPVVRELAIYKITNAKQAKAEGTFFSDVSTTLVQKVKTTKSGYFQVKLLPGKYSVFSVEPQGLFANRADGEGNINVVEVKPSAVTSMVFVIDYKAFY